jgi:RimJ/RimL family protein N-acetyltransferase
MVTPPILETARLRLRGHRREDFPDAYAMWADPIVVRHIGGKPSTPQQTWSRLLTYIGHWQAMRYGYWVMEDKETGAFIGEIGFADFKRDIDARMQDVPEFGFALVSSAHGKGYGTEAARAALDWGDANLPSKRTVCLVNESNAPSLHILQKLGYRTFEHATFGDAPVQFLERLP